MSAENLNTPSWNLGDSPETKMLKSGKWYKVETLTNITVPDNVFDYMLIWSPDGGLSMEDCDVLADIEGDVTNFSHFQLIKLPIKV